MSRLAIASFVVILACVGTGWPQEAKVHKPHPLAPSIPLLSDEEYAKIEKIIDRFIDFDSGLLPGNDGKKILADFEALGPEALPPLLEGLNKAANLQASCPAVIIAKKIKKLIIASTDGQLLDYVRDSVGLGVTIPRHQNSLKDLKLACMLRKSYLQQAGLLLPPGKKAPKLLGTDELANAAGKEKGPYLKQVLTELEQRDGEKVLIGLSAALARPEQETRLLAHSLLLKHLDRQSPSALKSLLQTKQEPVRLSVILYIGTRKLAWGDELIDALEDESPKVQQLARQALVQLSGGKDFGPAPTASASARQAAVEQWRQWWKGKNSSTSQNK